MNFDELLIVASFVKWIRSEPLSKEDINRIVTVIEKNDLAISSADQQTAAAIQVRLRHIVNTRFGGQANQV